MGGAKRQSTANTMIILMVICVILLSAVTIGIFVFAKVNPEAFNEVKGFVIPEKSPGNQTIIVQNQTINNNTTIDQKTNAWDVMKQVLWMLFILAILFGIVVAIVMLMKKVRQPLGRKEVIELHRQLLSGSEGHYRLEKSSADDGFGGTFLKYHPYYDGVGKEASSNPRAVSFWCIEKQPPNTPLKMIPKHLLLWVDTSIKSKQKLVDSATGPMEGQDWDDWQKWKHRQNFNLTGAKSSPMVNMEILTPEQQKEVQKKMQEKSLEALFDGGDD